jgi:hypothetical protein
MRTSDVLAAIELERARLFAAIDALGDQAATLPVTPDGWTSQDVVGHCIHYLGQLAFALRADIQPPSYVLAAQGRPSADEWNALAAAHYRTMSFDTVRGEFDRVLGLLLEKVRERTDEQMAARGAIAWDPERLLWQAIGGETFLHWPGHSADIERAALVHAKCRQSG